MKIGLIRVSKKLLYIAIVLLFLFFAFLASGRFIVSYLNKHIPNLEGFASRLLKVPVSMGRAHISWDVYTPVLMFDDVKFLNNNTHQQQFKIDHIAINLNIFKSLLYRDLFVDNIIIVGSHLSARQNKAGKWAVDGLGNFDMSDTQTGLSENGMKMIRWISSLSHLVLKDITFDIYFNNTTNHFSIAKLVLKNQSTSDRQQKILLNGRNIKFYFSPVFMNTIKMQNVYGTLNLTQDDNETWQLDMSNMQVTNADIDVLANMHLSFPKKDPAHINLSANFSVNDASKISNYLPLRTFNADLVTWLRNAFSAGRGKGKAIVEGNLIDFPFDNNNGKFLISSEVNDVDLDFAPGWPKIINAAGTLIFSGSTMTAKIASAHILDIPIYNATAEIPYIGNDKDTILIVESEVKSDFSSALHFIQSSPLRKTFSGLNQLTLNGPMDLKIGLTIPVEKPETTKIQGDLSFPNTTLKIPNWNLSIDEIKGYVHFTENDVTSNEMQGKMGDEQATITMATQHPANKPSFILTTLNTRFSVPEQIPGMSFALSPTITGKTNVTAQVYTYSGSLAQQNQVNIQTDLQGIAIDFPAPYGKKRDEKTSLSVNLMTVHDTLHTRISYGNQGTVELTNQNNLWHADINSPDVVGQADVSLLANKKTITGKFQHFYINSIPDSKISSFNIKEIPEINFYSENVRINGKELGEVTLNIMPNQSTLLIKTLTIHSALSHLDASGDWSSRNGKNTSHLSGTLSTSHLSDFLGSYGYGSKNFVGNKAELNFNLSWAGLPYQPTVLGLSGNASLKIGPGHILNVGSSSNNAKMDIGRLLNLFNLNEIPRRLTFNFSDVVDKGYSFDYIKGDFNFDNGNAFTENTKMDGPIAKIQIAGRIGLVKKDVDLKMNVTPSVTGSLPIVATVATGLNPIAGVATWAIDKVVGKAVSKVTTYHYTIKGPWDNPTWDKV